MAVLTGTIQQQRRTAQYRLFRVQWRAVEVHDGQAPLTAVTNHAFPANATNQQVLNQLATFRDQIEAIFVQGLVANDTDITDDGMVGGTF